MHVTAEMVEAARRAEYDYYQKGRQTTPGRFIPTPDSVIRAMIGAAIAHIPETTTDMPRIVTAKRPKLRR